MGREFVEKTGGKRKNRKNPLWVFIYILDTVNILEITFFPK